MTVALQMSKRLRWLGIFAVAVALLTFVWWFWFRGPVAHSDVPVTSEVGWWPYEDDVTITDVSAEAVNPDLGLGIFNDRSHFLMRFHIKGMLRPEPDRKDEKFKITKIQLTGRVLNRGTAQNNYEADAEVLLVPVVEPDNDANYQGEEVPFDLKIEHVFSAMDWGKNRYAVHCGGKTTWVVVSVAK